MVITDDSEREDAETFTLTIAADGVTATAGSKLSSTVTIGPSDQSTELSIADVTADEDVGTMTFTVTRSGVTTGASTVDYTIADGTAEAGQDYTATATGSLSYDAGDTTKTIDVTITDDSRDEEDTETFTVTLSGATGATISRPVATGAITDDDPLPTVSVFTTSVDEGVESQGEPGELISLRLDARSNRRVTVDFSTSIVAGTATWTTETTPDTDGTDDYHSASGEIAFEVGEQRRSFRIGIIDDTASEGPETFVIVFRDVTNAVSAGDGEFTVTINDDEPTELTLSTTSTVENDAGDTAPGVAEDASSVTITATLDKPATADLTVTLADAEDSGDTAADTEWALPSDPTCAIAEDAQSCDIEVTIDSEDTTDEPSKTFTLSATVDTTPVTTSDDFTITIADNDDAPTATLVLTPASISENGGSSTVTATLSGASSAETTLTVSAAAVSPAVSGDFTLSTNKVLTIAAGATTSTGVVTITAVSNDVDEDDKTVTVSAMASNTVGITTPADQPLTITDDDDPPVVSIEITAAEAAVNEGDSDLTADATVSLSAASGKTVTVDWKTADGTAEAGSDYTAVEATELTFMPGETSKTVTVTVLDDSEYEGSTESFDIVLEDPSNATLHSTNDSVTGNCSELVRYEHSAAFEEGIEASGPPGSK